ncbi:MAG: heme exporter protein CcmD [Rhizobiaceae bacterium]|nr:heme exporter protein CcmD [Rhizobiaceae bacterium]MCV0407554.1 heme exporter protein CcmD [Rhizobiaceae bacterium]
MSHEAYVLAAYGLSALIVGLLVVWIVLDGRARRRELAELEAGGMRRRSGSSPA